MNVEGMRMDHTLTPKMSRHALDRCREMGIVTKVAKAIYRHPCVTRPGAHGHDTTWDRYIVLCDHHPEYAIVVEDRAGVPWVVTVIFNTREFYQRQGETFLATKPVQEN